IRSCSSSCMLSFYSSPTTTLVCPLSLHDALPISHRVVENLAPVRLTIGTADAFPVADVPLDRAGRGIGAGHDVGAHRIGSVRVRSEEHTSELQSREKLVCRRLLAKTKRGIRQLHP